MKRPATRVGQLTAGSLAGKWVAFIDNKPLTDRGGVRIFDGNASAEAALKDELKQRRAEAA